jgi:hypothetical protein
MRTVGTAAAVGLATGIVGGVVGYFLVRLLVERLGIVEGPPAGVLLFTLPPFSLRFARSSASLWHYCGFAEKQRRMMSEIAICQQLSLDGQTISANSGGSDVA